MMRSLVIVLVFAMASCGDEPDIDERPLRLARLQIGLTSTSANVREMSAEHLLKTCCDSGVRGDLNTLLPACAQVSMLLHHDSDPERFAGIFRVYTNWDPACYEVIDDVAIGAAVARSRAYGRVENRRWLLRHVENYDPTPRLISLLVDELRHLDSDPTEVTAMFVLADLGEEDLASIVALVDDPDPVVRRQAISTLHHAMDDPLFLPEARAALQRATTMDPDPDIAGAARWVLDELDRQVRRGTATLESTLVRASRRDLGAIRRLGRRIIGCASPFVPIVLRHLANMEGWQYVHVRYTASRALANLERRCPTEPASTQPR
jgi:hypothetical protein